MPRTSTAAPKRSSGSQLSDEQLQNLRNMQAVSAEMARELAAHTRRDPSPPPPRRRNNRQRRSSRAQYARDPGPAREPMRAQAVTVGQRVVPGELAPLTPNEILPRGSSRYNEFMAQAQDIMMGESTEPIDRDAETARSNPVGDEEQQRRAIVQQVIQGIPVATGVNNNPIHLQRNAARQFALAMAKLTGKTLSVDVCLKFTRQRSYHAMHILTDQAIQMRNVINQMTRTQADAEDCLQTIIGHQWPAEGGDSMLIRALLSLTQESERADRQITEILLKAMSDMRTRPPRTPPSQIPGVVLVNLSDSSDES